MTVEKSEKGQVSGGSCLCEAVRYRVTGPLRPVIACHCVQCRKAYSNFAAFSAARRGELKIENPESVTWFESSPGVRRGFCRYCGSSLFWDCDGLGYVSVSAGTLDQPSGLSLHHHIYVADKGDFYEIGDGVECHAKNHAYNWPDDVTVSEAAAGEN